MKNLYLVSWSNGTVMLAIFAVVCLFLIGGVTLMVFAKKDKENGRTTEIEEEPS